MEREPFPLRSLGIWRASGTRRSARGGPPPLAGNLPASFGASPKRRRCEGGRRAITVQSSGRKRERVLEVSWREILAVQNKRASRHCDAPLLHWSGSPSIHGALP